MYKVKLDEIMYDVNNKFISSKIPQYMDNIRDKSDEEHARRFVRESGFKGKQNETACCRAGG